MQKIIVVCLFLAAFAQTVTAQPVVDYLRINTDVSNGYAITIVEEKLTNQQDSPAEDEFSFHIPDEAFISDFSLIIDGKEYSSSVLPKKEAKEKYEEASSRGKSSGLLESRNKNLFSYSLSFTSRQSITVRLKYEEAMKKNLGKYEYLLYLNNADTMQRVNDLQVNLNITSTNEITSLETPGFNGASVKYLSTTSGLVTHAASALPDKDLTVVYTTNDPPLNGEMLFYNADSQGYMMHIFSPNETALGTSALSKDIIFIIDKSGSMSGDKIAQVKRVFTNIISDLPPDDNFNVIFFDSSIRTYSKQLVEANEKNKEDAAKFVSSLNAEGGTNINQALLDALDMFGGSERVPIIVFLTDGEPTEGVKSSPAIRQNIKNANRVKVAIFTIAFGIEKGENYDFLKALSFENYGKAQSFFQEGNVEEEMSGFYKTISTPLITDMRFTYGNVSDIVNQGQNNLYAGSDIIVLGKYSGSAITSDIAAITRTGSRNFKNTFTVVSKPENSFIPRLWAYTRIKNLIDQIDVEGEKDILVSEATQLSLQFGFVTPYTSFFVEVPSSVSGISATSIDLKAQIIAAPAAPSKNSNTNSQATPGFEVMSAIIGLLAVLVLQRRGRK